MNSINSFAMSGIPLNIVCFKIADYLCLLNACLTNCPGSFVFFNDARYSFYVVLHWKLCFKFGSICMLFGCLRCFYSIFYFVWYWMSKLRKYFKTIHSQLRIQYLFVLFTLLFIGSIYLIHLRLIVPVMLIIMSFYAC